LGNKDIFVSKLNSSGNLIWAKVMGGTNIDAGLGLAVDGGGNVYTSGFFQGTADFDPGAGTDTHSPVWGADIFISILDANGNYVSAKVIGSANDDYGYSIGLDAYNNIYTTGSFGGVADFDPDAGTANLTSAGANDVFILKLGQASVGIIENGSRSPSVSFFPNPANGVITIVNENSVAPYKVRLMNASGQCLREVKNSGLGYLTMDITSDSAGLYFLEVIQGSKISRMKLVKVD
jgi:hypothetical protein